MKEEDNLYIGHILDAIDRIDGYLRGVDMEIFVANPLLIDGVARQLSIIGEAANHFSEEFQGEHPEVPFRDIVGMRNIIIHEYTGVSVAFLWETYESDLPKLRKELLPFRP
jgi:uncharacterized protein with HEPN domain